MYSICRAATVVTLTTFSSSSLLAAQAALSDARATNPVGFDLSWRDLSVRPGGDFNRFASGHWLDTTVIPADRQSASGREEIYTDTQAALRAIVEADARLAEGTGDTARIGRLYTSFMAESTVERLGAGPLTNNLAQIRAASDRQAIAALMGRTLGGFGASLFQVSVYEDLKDPGQMVAYLHQDGLGLPTRAFYLDAKFRPLKSAYCAYVEQMLTLAGWADAKQSASAIVAFETNVASVHWRPEQTRDFLAMYNPATLSELRRMAPEFDWAAWSEAAGLPASSRLIASENTAFPKIAHVFGQTDMATLRAWLAFHAADQAAPYLSKAFVDTRFAFRGTMLRGTTTNQPRAARGVQLVDQQMGEALGQQYVKSHLTPTEKKAAVALVGNVQAAMRARLQRNNWMSISARAEAVRKIDNMRAKIGYPDRWRSYERLRVDVGDLYGNVERAFRFEWSWQTGRLTRPADPDAWDITPQTVNGYYNASRNEIVLPASILRAFNPGADPAIVYGALGGFVGHEITHGFDDNGRRVDGDGLLRDWWTTEDAARFQKRAAALGAQYDMVEAMPGVHLSGKLTMSENIADLGGITLAIDAYHRALGGKRAPIVGGISGDQRVFLGWALAFREKIRDQALREQIATDEHAPGAYRINMPIRNVSAWYDAYRVSPRDRWYLTPAKRVTIW